MVLVATGDRIREFRESRTPKITQEQLAEWAGIKRSRLAQYETGRTEPPLPVLKKIAKALGTQPNDLIDDSPSPETARPRRVRAEPSGKIKIYGAASAGTGATTSFDADELDVPIQFARDDYGALVIEGDSMMPFLHPSDVAIFRDWKAQKPGFIQAVVVNDEWLVKQVVYENGRFKLRSLNGDYEDIEGEFQTAGFLVGFIRDDGPERLIRLNPYGLRPE